MSKGKSLLSARGKKKIPRVSEIEKREIVNKFYGKDAPPISDRARFLNWANFTVDMTTSREWLEEYLAPSGRTATTVPNEWINTSVCHRARLKTLGAPFTETQDSLLEEGIREILSHARVPEEDEGDSPSIQDRIRKKFSYIMGELEGLIDDRPDIQGDFDFDVWCREKEVSPKIASMILARLRPRLEELKEALTNPDLAEAYRNYHETEQDEIYIGFFVKNLEKMVENQKRARVARKPKPVSLEKKLKHINEIYLKYSKEWNITSIDPSKIVGASELWTLNVRYKLITVFRGKLDVARCKVTGFDPEQSQTYRLGRGKKQITLVEEVMKSTRPGIKRVVSDLKKSDYLLERINENTVLLRVF